MSIIFKTMDKSDVKSVVQIEKECFSHPWSEASIYEELDNPLSFTVVAVSSQKSQNCENEDAAGFINARIINDEVYINNIAVKKEFKRKGIGKGLLSALEKKAGEVNASFITLEVRESNLPAISLYASFGYKIAGKRKKFYRDPIENAVLMTKNLPQLFNNG